ncbi:DUF2958 domain-containing protein [Bradyrhizobium vignae]|uniref:DUF2958 domain-containing protein n=1 Tax=Bradyrhizobium vignae TaxID=1549949 RepID=UPI001FDFF1F8|nr:DUF2958 domain-containing protein [Bradyrhizobium vignae]
MSRKFPNPTRSTWNLSSSRSSPAVPPPGCSPRLIPDDYTVAWALRDLGIGFPEFGTVSLTELAAFRGRSESGSNAIFTGTRADLG